MFDPDENLKIAVKIHGDKGMSNEAGVRAAVSRCYYSSLLTVKPYLGSAVPDDDRLHGIAMCFVQKMDRRLGDRLGYLYELRLKADMASGVTWDRDMIADVHGVAKRFNDEIKRILSASSARPRPSP